MSTSTAITKPQSGGVQGILTKEDIATLVSSGIIPEGTTEPTIRLFARYCAETGLSPFRRQVHLVKRYSKSRGDTFTIQTGIDGYRAIASRTGQCAGIEDAAFDNETSPKKATVTVFKLVDGVRCSFVASARWNEYCPADERQGFMWKKMPHLMLGKCAEALALRKAFPDELGGIYTDEEMQQADVVETPLKNEKPTAQGRALFDDSGSSAATGEKETLLLLGSIEKANDKARLEKIDHSRRKGFDEGKITLAQSQRVLAAIEQREEEIERDATEGGN